MSSAPDDIRAMARKRSAARAARDWPEADRLRTEIEAAGWRIVDRGTDFSLEPAHAPDVVEAGRARHGSSASVPSRLAEPDSAVATVILLATDQPADLARTLAALRAYGPAATEVVIVADGASPEQEAALVAADGPAAAGIGGRPVEIAWTSQPLGQAAAPEHWPASSRRTGRRSCSTRASSRPATSSRSWSGPSTIDRSPSAGPWGITSDDLRRFDEAPPGDVDAIEGYALAFRRADLIERGLLDEHFRFYRNLDIWWSLVLRDEGLDRSPRRAIRIADLAAIRHEHRGYSSLAPAERDRLSKRNFYRIIDRFGARRDLLVSAADPAR